MASFNEAFKAARKAQGAGGTFTWKGKSYSTNLEGEKGTKKKTSFSTDMANNAINKAAGVQSADSSTPRPKPRPVDKTPTPISAPETITASKLGRTPDTSVAGQLGSAAAKGVAYLMGGPKTGASATDAKESNAMKRKAVLDTPTPPSVTASREKIALGKLAPKTSMRPQPRPKTMAKGGSVGEGSAKDMREDKMKAKKAGMSMKTWEKSAADKKHDAPKKMAGGGVVKKASGGSMRGAGCAVRGKGFSGSY